MVPVSRALTGIAAAVGLAAVLASCKPASFPPPSGGGNPPSTITAAPVTSSPATPTPTPPRTTPTTRPPTPVVTTPPGGGTKADEVVRLTNVERSKAGCGALTVDARLTTAAQAHTVDMAQKNYFSHTSLDGRTFADRIRATGFPASLIGENIAAGGTTAAQTVEMWMNSAGHRANILNCSYTRIGVGYAEGGSYRYYWTQDFGKV